jgi:hypothetical protein
MPDGNISDAGVMIMYSASAQYNYYVYNAY